MKFRRNRLFMSFQNIIILKEKKRLLTWLLIDENIGEIAVLITKDLIDEFISYVSQKEYRLNSHIEDSLFESNLLLHKLESYLF